MNAHATLAHLSPAITKMIRLDHTHVLSIAHAYETSTGLHRKQAIANTVCAALEVHAQLEEEIFYPALRAAGEGGEVMDSVKPEHDQMRSYIAELRSRSPSEEGYDAAFHALMREVLHHVADEETVLLPAAERLLAPQLGELGARMTQRRMQLLAPRLGDFAKDHAVATPGFAVLLAGVALTGVWLAARAMLPRRTTAR